MKRLIPVLTLVLLIVACGGKGKEEIIPAPPAPSPTPIPTCKVQFDIRVGYNYREEFIEVSKETVTAELVYDEWDKGYYSPQDLIKDSVNPLQYQLRKHFLDIRLEKEYQYWFETCPVEPIEVHLWVHWNDVSSYSHEGISISVAPETLSQIMKKEEVPHKLPAPNQMSPEQFSAAVTRAVATYQIQAYQINQAIVLFNLASQEEGIEFITTMSDGYLWGALIPTE